MFDVILGSKDTLLGGYAMSVRHVTIDDLTIISPHINMRGSYQNTKYSYVKYNKWANPPGPPVHVGISRLAKRGLAADKCTALKTHRAAWVHKRATVSHAGYACLGHRHAWAYSDCGAGFITIHSRPLQLCSFKVYPGSSICRSIRSLAAACPKVARLWSQLKQIAPVVWQSRSHRAQCGQFVGS